MEPRNDCPDGAAPGATSSCCHRNSRRLPGCSTSRSERLHVWGTRSGGEIDFVCGPPRAIEAVEVADWEMLNRQKATAPARALPGRPALVATRDELEFGRTANLVPAPLLLWALGDAGP